MPPESLCAGEIAQKLFELPQVIPRKGEIELGLFHAHDVGRRAAQKLLELHEWILKGPTVPTTSGSAPSWNGPRGCSGTLSSTMARNRRTTAAPASRVSPRMAVVNQLQVASITCGDNRLKAGA